MGFACFKRTVRSGQRQSFDDVINEFLEMKARKNFSSITGVKKNETYRTYNEIVSIVSDYGLENRAIGVRSPAGVKDFSSSLCVQTGSGAHPASCTVGTGGKSAAGA
jgi:predicted CopG family antitoxin